jgi:hypothetical protein
MALPASGLISISDINVELSLASNYASSLNDTALRTLAGVPSGAISFSNFHGKSSWAYSYAKGWLCAGAVGGATNANSVADWSYSTETASTLGMTLVQAKSAQASFHSTTHGYDWGGWTGAYSTEIDGVVFASNTLHNPAAVLPAAIGQGGGVNSLVKGYVGGGYAPYAAYNTIAGLLFSNDSTFTLSATLATARSSMAPAVSETKGYWMGGNTYNVGLNTEIDGLLFSNETAINPSAVLSLARTATTGTSSATKGYALGGNNANATPYSEIDGIEFATESAINPAAALVSARWNLMSLNSQDKGYAIGGYNGSSYFSEVDGIQFSNDAAINPSAGLPATRSGGVGISGGAR